MGSANTDSHVDVLIVGAGPAGMMASLSLSELGISHRIIDHRGTRTLNGRADGLALQTVAIWESFGLYDHVEKFSQTFGQWALWTFGEDSDVPLSRHIRDHLPGGGAWGSRLRTGTFHQGMIEATLGNGVRARNGPEAERGAKPVSLEIDESQVSNLSSHPVTVRVNHVLKSELPDAWTGAHSVQEDGALQRERGIVEGFGTDPHQIEQHVTGPEGTTETIRAKYVIGADGAHSWVRRQLPGFKMEGNSSSEIFGVIDIIPVTNFPDVRKACSILSKAGFSLLIPREKGMIRLYVQFPEGYVPDATKDWQSTVAEIMRTANSILHPYTIDYRYCDWFTVFTVGQRVCNKFSHLNRVFLVGDAIHTHSPKVGQGSNISQQDAHNLAWKIAGVLRGQFSSQILGTYEEERLHVARLLIELDKIQAAALFARLYRDEDAVVRAYGQVKKFYEAQRYKPSWIVVHDGEEGVSQNAASELRLGDRVLDANVFNQASGTQTALWTLLKSDGLWTLLLFAGDVSQEPRRSKINAIGARLGALQQRYVSLSKDNEVWLRTLLFHSGEVSGVEMSDFHDTYFPFGKHAGRSHDRIFGDFDGIDVKNTVRAAHAALGVDLEKGALVIIRPDRIVAWVGYVEDIERMEEWLDKFMIVRTAAMQK